MLYRDRPKASSIPTPATWSSTTPHHTTGAHERAG